MNIIIFFIILLVLVLVHEFGHFFAAKSFNIRVNEFGFGFPPKLFGIKKGETLYSFNLLPIGGFVKIFGDNADVLSADKSEGSISATDASRAFINKPKYKQAAVLLAGVFANFLLAWFLFAVGFMSGLPTSVGSEPKGYTITDSQLVLVSIAADSPAEASGLKSRDRIISIRSEKDSVSEVSPETLKSFIVSHKGEEIELGYLRGNDEITRTAKMTPSKNSIDGDPAIGVAMDQIGIVKLPFLKAFKEGMALNWSVTERTALGLFTLIKDGISGKGSFSGVTGPVGMVGIAGDAYQFGFIYLLSFVALVSVNLAIINLVPFPALDGGRLLFLLIEKIKGSRLSPKLANAANLAGFAILIILMLLITYRDVTKLL